MSVIVGGTLMGTLMVFYIFASDPVFLAVLLNTTAMLGLWTSYATTIREAPAPYLHPWRLPKEPTNNPNEVDLEAFVL